MKQSRKLRKLALTKNEYKEMKKANKPSIVHLNHKGYARRAYIAYLNKRYIELTRKPRTFHGKDRRQIKRESVMEFFA